MVFISSTTRFFFFPTQFHQQAERVRPETVRDTAPLPAGPEGIVAIRHFFVVEWASWIEDWPTLRRLEPFHVWREDVIRERFEYGEQSGLQCAFGRVYRLDPEWTLPDRPGFGGCRSWLTLPGAPAVATVLTPVLDDARFTSLAAEVRAALQP